jgi:hypothetical protein
VATVINKEIELFGVGVAGPVLRARATHAAHTAAAKHSFAAATDASVRPGVHLMGKLRTR